MPPLDSVPAGCSIVLAVISDSAGFAKGEWSGTVNSELGSATIGIGKKAGKISEKYEFTYTGTVSDAVKNNDVLAMVFKDNKGNYSQLVYQSDDTPVTTTLKVTGLDANDFAASQTFTSKNFSYNLAAPIPEPTSGLLLLLGMAGLALRRRRA